MNKQSLEAMELLNNKSHLLSEYMNSRDKEGKTILMYIDLFSKLITKVGLWKIYSKSRNY